MKREELFELLSECNQQAVKSYLEVFDRTLLQAIVIQALDPETISELFNHCQQQIKMEIDIEANARTSFIHGTELGKMIKANNLNEDGETFRLQSLKAVDVAKTIAKLNYLPES